MDIRTYLFIHRMTQYDFARLIDYAPTYVNSVITGKRKPGKKMKKDILKATKNKVTFEEDDARRVSEDVPTQQNSEQQKVCIQLPYTH